MQQYPFLDSPSESNFTGIYSTLPPTAPIESNETYSQYDRELDEKLEICGMCLKPLNTPKIVMGCGHQLHAKCHSEWSKKMDVDNLDECNHCWSGQKIYSKNKLKRKNNKGYSSSKSLTNTTSNTSDENEESEDETSNKNNNMINKYKVTRTIKKRYFDVNGKAATQDFRVEEGINDKAIHVDSPDLPFFDTNSPKFNAPLTEKQKDLLLTGTGFKFPMHELYKIPINYDSIVNEFPHAITFEKLRKANVTIFQMYGTLGFDSWSKFLEIPDLDKVYFLPEGRLTPYKPVIKRFMSKIFASNEEIEKESNFVDIGHVSNLYSLSFADLKRGLNINLVDLARSQIHPKYLVSIGLTGRVLLGDEEPEMRNAKEIPLKPFSLKPKDFRLNRESFEYFDSYIEDYEWTCILGVKKSTLKSLRAKCVQ